MPNITDEEWDKLWEDDPFETALLLRLVDTVDWRGHGALRDQLLKLHQLSMDVFNRGTRHQVGKLFELAVDLENQFRELGGRFDRVKTVLAALTELYPESLSYDASED